ncbi:MAG: 2-C-methyl-D-erythritol 4-phosphate cytidylyltransferase [Thermodesulfovibrionales bacterium]|nr:2-C-methyl-D-erythritol 4-phosphate cytidylyltransferase [Thermodesulfovibrionales bacterium]
MITAIIPAAGRGLRFGSDENKTFYPLKNKPLLLWPLQTLEAFYEVEDIIVVVRFEDIDRTSKLIDKYGIKKVRKIIGGGKERQDSVFNALKSIDRNTQFVLIHDGVRPFLDTKLLKSMILQFVQNQRTIDGIITGVPVKDTIKSVERGESGSDHNGLYVKETLKRDLLWAIHTPQLFVLEKILAAYKKAMKDNFYSTDDSALLENYGGKIKLFMGSYKNIKITTIEDIKIAEALLQ